MMMVTLVVEAFGSLDSSQTFIISTERSPHHTQVIGNEGGGGCGGRIVTPYYIEKMKRDISGIPHHRPYNV